MRQAVQMPIEVEFLATSPSYGTVVGEHRTADSEAGPERSIVDTRRRE
jgi:hypothetical protein